MSKDLGVFEQAIIDGIVRQFFVPAVYGYNQDGTPMTSPSPASTIASTFFQQNKDEISKKVMEKLSVDEIAEGVYTRLKEDLQTPLDRYNYYGTARKEFDESVRKQVVKIVAEAKAAEMMKEDEPASNE